MLRRSNSSVPVHWLVSDDAQDLARTTIPPSMTAQNLGRRQGHLRGEPKWRCSVLISCEFLPEDAVRPYKAAVKSPICCGAVVLCALSSLTDQVYQQIRSRSTGSLANSISLPSSQCITLPGCIILTGVVFQYFQYLRVGRQMTFLRAPCPPWSIHLAITIKLLRDVHSPHSQHTEVSLS